MADVNGPTGPLARGWCRVTWPAMGKLRYVVSECPVSVGMLAVHLEARGIEGVRLEAWSDYPYVGGVYVPPDDVPRET